MLTSVLYLRIFSSFIEYSVTDFVDLFELPYERKHEQNIER